jgi:hypothetical protein
MEPALDYQLDLRPGAPEQFGLAVRGKLDGDFKLALEAPQGGVQWRREMELGKVSQRLVQSLGPVPVWEDVSLSLVAGIEGRVDSAVSMVVDIHVEEDASFGVFRQDGKWKVEKDINDGQLVFERPVFQASVNASAQAYVKVRLAVSLYSVVQTFLDAEARTAARMLFTPKPLPVSWVGSMGIQAGAKILWPGGGGPEMAFDLYRLEEATPIPPDSSVVVSWNGSQGRTTVLRASEP